MRARRPWLPTGRSSSRATCAGTDVVAPRDAASVVLLRDGAAGHETFEEAGDLLAAHRDGTPLTGTTGEDRERDQRW